MKLFVEEIHYYEFIAKYKTKMSNTKLKPINYSI